MKRELPPGSHGADSLRIGDGITCGELVVTTEVIDSFADMTGDRFEIHLSDEAARAHGFGDRVAHGLLVLSLVDGMKNQAPAQLKARASMGWDWRFRRPVLAGDKIAVSYEISAIDLARTDDQAVLTLDFKVTNQNGDVVQSGTNRLLAYR